MLSHNFLMIIYIIIIMYITKFTIKHLFIKILVVHWCPPKLRNVTASISDRNKIQICDSFDIYFWQ